MWGKLRAWAIGLAACLVLVSPVEDAKAAPASTERTTLAALALPYSPYMFDLAVYAVRNVAEVTYGARRYDPVTRSLIVTGLTVTRGEFAARIGQLRVSSEGAVLDDVAVDTRALPLNPIVRAVLQRLDRQILSGSVSLASTADPATADYAFDAEIRIDGAGTLNVDADIGGFHILMPLSESGPASDVEIVGRLRSAEAAFSDAGLVAALYEVMGEREGLDPAQAQASVMMMSGIGITSGLAALPGGDRPALDERAQTITRAVQAFIASPDRLTVSLEPSTPFDLRRLSDGMDGSEILDLSPTAVAGETPKLALVDPKALEVDTSSPVGTVLPAAKALIEGVGLPQDLTRGVALVLPAATEGNRVAIVLLARAIGLDPGVEIAQDRLRGAYVALLLAKADGLLANDDGLDALRSRLSPEEVVAGEDEALKRWQTTATGSDQHRIEREAFRNRDWRTIRRLAFAYYDGTSMPRNGMRAYGWASIAAAGGDRIAAELRDDLTAAVSEGRLVLPIERARDATTRLWSTIIDESREVAAGSQNEDPPANIEDDRNQDREDAGSDGAALPEPEAAEPSSAPPSLPEPSNSQEPKTLPGDGQSPDR